MRKCLYFVTALAALFSVESARAQAPQVTWGRAVTGSATTSAAFIKTATDWAGNVYALAEGRGALLLDGVTYPRIGTTTTQVLVKYDSSGQVLWQKRVELLPGGGSATEGAIQKLLVDGAGDVVVMGNTLQGGQHLVLDHDTIMQTAVDNYFIAKLTPAGQPIWTKNGSSLMAIGYDLTVGTNDDLYMTGHAERMNAPAVFDSITFPMNGIPMSWFAARFSGSDGRVRWARMGRRLPMPGFYDYSSGEAIRTDAAGNAYLLLAGCGFRLDTLTVGSTAVEDTAMWLKLSPTGRALAGRVIPAWTIGQVNFIDPKLVSFAVDPAGNSYSVVFNSDSATMPIPPVVRAPPRTWPVGSSRSLLKLDPVGAVDWVKPLPGKGYFSLPLIGLTTDRAGRVYCGLTTGRNGQTLDNYPNLASGDAFVARLNPRSGLADALLPISGARTEDVLHLSASPSGQLAVGGVSSSDSTYLGTELVFAQAGRNQAKGVLGKLNSDVNLLTGAAFVDANGNNVHDVGEGGYAFGSVVAVSPGTRQFVTNEAAAYAAPVGPGTHTVTLASEPLYHTVTALPPAATTFAGYGQTAPGASFALQPVPGQQDLQVFLSSSAAYLGGSAVSLGLSYRNIGTTPIDSGRVVLAYDTALTYFRSSRTPTSSGPGQLTWRFTHLLPGQVQHIGTEFSLNATPPDSLLTSSATVTPLAGDLTQADNVATVAEPILPNPYADTTTVSLRQLTLQQVQSGGEWLTYSVRFQNPFADSIYRITLRDSLPDALRRGTVDVVGASHPFAWTLAPDGVLEIRLDGARLAGPNAGANRAGAYVQFRLRPDVALPVGTRIAHRAQVYLDGQRALTLPEAVTEVVADPLGTATSVAALVGSAWPNPVAGVLHVAVTLPVAGAVTVQLRDATGRLVRHAQQAAARGSWRGEVSTAGLPGGLYLLDVRGGGQRFSRRIVVAGVE